ncbi:MAG: hypothetical protein QNJ81_11445 [Acidimicrobiia bacterium]|nr:hypothetical protein [Acidimicrobiia bacterium]
MSGIDYEELIRSPLDDVPEKSGTGWSVLIGGLGLGMALGLLVALGLGGGDDEPAVAADPATTTSTTAAPVAEPSEYPVGFVELGAGFAAKSGEVILGDELITVAFTAAARRGDDPQDVAWPVGGSWLLESASGTVVESSRVVVGRFSPAAFTVQFPAQPFNGETEFSGTSAIERWDTEVFTGSVQIPFGGEPFVAPETISIPVNQDVTLIVPTLKLGRFLGSAAWQTVGAPLGTTVAVVATLLDENGEVIGSYERFPENLDPADSGVIEIYWSEPFPIGQEGGVTVSLEYTVGVVEESPVSVSFDLSNVPVGR